MDRVFLIIFMNLYIYPVLVLIAFISCRDKKEYDVIIRGGTVYDGSGKPGTISDVGINADTIAFTGDLSDASAKKEIGAKGMAVAPGFINMLSWANESLIEDGLSQGDIRQGITLEVMGEGWSMGPLNEQLKKQQRESQTDIKYKIEWNTLGEYLNYLEKKGVSCNVASFVGATTIREYVIGEDNRDPSAAELDSMKLLVRQAMEEGAMGVGSSLIYPPAFFAKTNELIELCKEASKYGGSYISHIRSEGEKLYEAVEELITIAGKANIHAEIYHLKSVGKDNWFKTDSVIRRIEKERKNGNDITANMYLYTAAGTALTATMPPQLQDGGFDKLRNKLKNSALRKQTIKDMNSKTDKWENFYYGAGTPENILLTLFRQDSLKKYIGKSLAEIAKLRGKSAEETAMDLIVQDSSKIQCIYFLMNEDNIKKQIAIPWLCFGSDEGSYSPEGVFLKFSPHPRAYGNFARLLGKYVRDEKVIPLEEAIRKLTSLPATNLKIKNRGLLKPGYFADLVIFDPAKIKDNATYENPHQFATGMMHVFVNGVQALNNGEHSGAKPGRVVRGPGYKK